jgi:hypothetical protein
MPPDKASNHHYRQCRKEWQVKVKKDNQNKFGNLTKCDAFQKCISYDMIILANAIEKHVLRVISDLKLTKRSK